MSERHLYPSVVLAIEFDNLSWVSGSKLAVPPPKLEFEIKGHDPFVWCDYIRPAANIPLFSPQLRDSLKAVGVDNVEYYEATVRHELSKETRPYFAANVIGLVRGMNRDLSEFEPFDDDALLVEEIEKLVLDDDALRGVRLCRLAEFDLLLVADEAVKAAVEQAGLGGVLFLKPEDWDGFAT